MSITPITQTTPACYGVCCPHCNKHPKASGLSQHIRDAHGIKKDDQ